MRCCNTACSSISPNVLHVRQSPTRLLKPLSSSSLFISCQFLLILITPSPVAYEILPFMEGLFCHHFNFLEFRAFPQPLLLSALGSLSSTSACSVTDKSYVYCMMCFFKKYKRLGPTRDMAACALRRLLRRSLLSGDRNGD